MEDTRIDGALSRIEEALTRIEQAAAATRPGSEGGWTMYRNLKGKVRHSLAELDTVIAELER